MFVEAEEYLDGSVDEMLERYNRFEDIVNENGLDKSVHFGAVLGASLSTYEGMRKMGYEPDTRSRRLVSYSYATAFTMVKEFGIDNTPSGFDAVANFAGAEMAVLIDEIFEAYRREHDISERIYY